MRIADRYDEYPWEDSASWTSVNHIHDSAARRLKKDLEAEEDSSNIKRVRRRRAEKIINQVRRPSHPMLPLVVISDGVEILGCSTAVALRWFFSHYSNTCSGVRTTHH